MSSQFSYELDERQIRLMMQDAELEYNEALWHKFDEMSVTQAKSVSQIGNFVPKINIGISRSVIVPVIFIILIGGLSAMLFSFVDFKKKEAIEKEIPYVATVVPEKLPETSSKPIIKPKTVATPSITAAKPIIDTTTIAVVTSSVNATTEPIVKKEEPLKVEESKSKVAVTASEPKKETVIVPHKKKKKIKTEVLPTINAATTTNLNEGVAEPELDLK